MDKNIIELLLLLFFSIFSGNIATFEHSKKIGKFIIGEISFKDLKYNDDYFDYNYGLVFYLSVAMILYKLIKIIMKCI